MLVRGRGRRMAAARDCEREFMLEIRSGARLSQVSAASRTWRGKQLLSFRKASLNAKIPHLIFRQSANLSKPAQASRISRGTFSTRRVPVIKRAAVLCSRSRRSALIVPRPLQARDAYSRTGRTQVRKRVWITRGGTWGRNRRSKPSLEEALLTIVETWSVQVSHSSMLRPRCFWTRTCLISLPLIMIEMVGTFCLVQRTITAVFSTLMVSAHDLNQEDRSLAAVCKESCRFCAESDTVKADVSSANRFTSPHVDAVMSFI